MITIEISAPEFVRRFENGEIPSSARVTVTYEDVPDPTLAIIEDWLAQAPTDAAAIVEAEADLREVQTALDGVRKEAGARLLYPELENSTGV